MELESRSPRVDCGRLGSRRRVSGDGVGMVGCACDSETRDPVLVSEFETHGSRHVGEHVDEGASGREIGGPS